MSRRTSSGDRSPLASIAAQGLLCPLCLLDRLLGDRRRPPLEGLDGAEREYGDDEEQCARDDEERCPGRQDALETGGPGRQPEAERVEEEDCRRDGESDADCQRRRLALDLEAGQLELEACERAGVLGDVACGGAEGRVGVLACAMQVASRRS